MSKQIPQVSANPEFKPFRFNDKAAELLKTKGKVSLKTKPEPWLHVMLMSDFEDRDKHQKPCTRIVVYVWDTRKVVEEAMIAGDWPRKLFSANDFTKAADNKKPLQGSGTAAKLANGMWSHDEQMRKQTAAWRRQSKK